MIEKDGDYITIYTKDGTQLKAELAIKFKIENQGEYVIYKLNDKFYAAKYKFDGNITTLITDLTDSEKKIINEVFIKMEVE